MTSPPVSAKPRRSRSRQFTSVIGQLVGESHPGREVWPPAVGPRGNRPAWNELRVTSDMDDDVDALADELANRLHLGGRSEAILFALRASLAAAGDESLIRRDRLLEVMNSEIWPLLDDREPISKDERENILGLNPSTGA